MPYPDIYYKPKAEQSRAFAMDLRASAISVRDTTYYGHWKPEADGLQQLASSIFDAARPQLTPAQIEECEGWLTTGTGRRGQAAQKVADGNGGLLDGDRRVDEGNRLYDLTAYADSVPEFDASHQHFIAAKSNYEAACQLENQAMAVYGQVNDFIVALNLPPG
jgi:hypothetical protein